MRLALYHPQIPQNTGTLLRLGACLGVPLDLIRPFGFLFDNKKLKRAGLDYISMANYTVHNSFDDFIEKYKTCRLIAMESNDVKTAHTNFDYQADDIIIVGSEHYGFLKQDLLQIPYKIKIPMLTNRRSLNMAISAAIVIGEALSQLKLYPPLL